MKKTLLTALSLGSIGLASAQTTAYTQPVGYVKLGNTTSGTAVPASTDITVSVPFHNKIEQSLTVTASTATSITVSNALVAGELVVTSGQPYVMVVADGAGEGLMAIISANTTSELTATPLNGGDLSTVDAASQIQIFKATTLSTFFPSDLPAGTRCQMYSNNATGINISPDLAYVYSGTDWLNVLGGTLGSNSNDVILLPGESVVLRSSSAISELVVSGTVPIFNHMTPIPQFEAGVSQDTRLSYFGPGEETLLDSEIANLAGDRLLVYDQDTTGINKSPSQIFVFNGTGWVGVLGVVLGSNQDNYVLEAGQGYVFRSASNTPVGTSIWTDEQTYRAFLDTE